MNHNTWIKVHSGLTNDPKHRERIGIRVWYFMWLVEHADYEDGVVYNCTDKWTAECMSDPDHTISERTVERWRQDLADAGYIICHQGYHCQHIRIMRWRNPRLVNPPQINVPGPESSYAELRTMGDHPPSKLRTPTLDSQYIYASSFESEYLQLFGFTMSYMDQTLYEDLAKEFNSELLRAALREIHARGISSIKYLAKMVRGSWKPKNKADTDGGSEGDLSDWVDLSAFPSDDDGDEDDTVYEESIEDWIAT